MSALPPLPAYRVAFGKNGALGIFQATLPMPTLRRGTTVVVRSPRGVEFGTVLGLASPRQAELLHADSANVLLRPASSADAELRFELEIRSQSLFDASRQRAAESGLDLEILDLEFIDEGEVAILQFVGSEHELETFATQLEDEFHLTIRFENLAIPATKPEGGCDKPDCGKEAGGCSTCSTGGGCTSCSTGKNVDLRDYFSHLRSKMEPSPRIPLV